MRFCDRDAQQEKAVAGNPAMKAREREKIARDVAVFLAAGGEIQRSGIIVRRQGLEMDMHGNRVQRTGSR